MKYKLSVKRRVDVYHDDVKDEGYFKGHRERSENNRQFQCSSICLEWRVGEAWLEVNLAKQARLSSYSGT